MSTNNVIVKDWRKIDFSFGLIYPNKFTLGMSSYSIRLLYFLINSFNNIACERIFIPDNLYLKFPASKDYSSKNILRSLENKVLPEEFDILGFSLHFENDLKNIFWILEKAEIPLTFQERQKMISKDNAQFPLLIAGGPAVTSNPIPLSKFFDILFIGDSEQNLKLFFDLYQIYNNQEIIFKEFLERAKNIEGLFIPALKNKTERVVLKDLDDSPTPIFQLIFNQPRKKSIFENYFFIEVNRGCPFQCKFCISSFHNYPFRNKSYENIIKSIQQSLKYSKYETISLIGSCVSSHPKFREICEYIIGNEKRLSVPSIRVEHLTQDIIQLFEKAEIKTITIAPETGSERLRYSLGKKIANEKIISILTQIKDSQIKNIKFYFLIGLPNEEEKDVDEIINLLKSIDQLGFTKNTLRLNINPFIPKLNTPYEKEISFYLDENLPELTKKYQKLERELKNITSLKLRFKNFKSIIKNARLQAMISLGNKQISDLLLEYYYNGATFSTLQKAEKEFNFSLNDYLLKIKECYSPWTI
ncbi:MAG: radical SAM protein [Candidatus Lokiarchaeota archaeon]|nr:radical SAM protein [Candidatus Lokiarchaeota archaeon]